MIIVLPEEGASRVKTDWNLIREATNTAIDSCERPKSLGYTEEHPPATDVMAGMVSWYRNHFDTNVDKAITPRP